MEAIIGALDIGRQMLHAESLSLLHPNTGHPMTFTAPPPADMQEVIAALRHCRGGHS